MKIRNAVIADVFNEIADLLEIKNENPFRIRAYRTAARTIGGLSRDVTEMILDSQNLAELPGIGKDLAAKIIEIAETGHSKFLDRLKENLNPELITLMKIAGLGGKRVGIIYSRLGVYSLETLEQAAREHKISQLPGFGEKIERNILEGIEQIRNIESRILFYQAEEVAQKILEYLRSGFRTMHPIIAGSYRRCKDSIRDLDILAVGKKPEKIAEYFLKYPGMKKVIARGDTKASMQIASGLQIDLRIVPGESLGAALHYFTGSQAHNIAIRKRGVKLGLKINEYGVYKDSIRLSGDEESDVFSAVGFPFIAPELREDSGEIEAAEKDNLPELIELRDIQGDLHSHTTFTDGHAGISEMAEAAHLKHYEYLAITDHSRRLTVAHGLNEEELHSQIEKLRVLNSSSEDVKLLSGIEVDILEDGSLDLPASILSKLDIVICSIHSQFNLSREKQTRRIMKAIEHPDFMILGHPTGRIINKRAAMTVEWDTVFKALQERSGIVEINSYPDRMDLDDTLCRMAKDAGLRFSIATDAHSTADLDFMRYGINQARRGWLEKYDVVNTLSLDKLKIALHRRKK